MGSEDWEKLITKTESKSDLLISLCFFFSPSSVFRVKKFCARRRRRRWRLERALFYIYTCKYRVFFFFLDFFLGSESSFDGDEFLIVYWLKKEKKIFNDNKDESNSIQWILCYWSSDGDFFVSLFCSWDPFKVISVWIWGTWLTQN